MLKKEKRGSMHKLTVGKHYCLINNSDVADKLETMQDIIDFWEKQQWIIINS